MNNSAPLNRQCIKKIRLIHDPYLLDLHFSGTRSSDGWYLGSPSESAAEDVDGSNPSFSWTARAAS